MKQVQLSVNDSVQLGLIQIRRKMKRTINWARCRGSQWTRRIQSSVRECAEVQVVWVWVEWHRLPPDWVKHQLVQEGVVGPGESLHVFCGDRETHLEVVAHLPDHLHKQQRRWCQEGFTMRDVHHRLLANVPILSHDGSNPQTKRKPGFQKQK